MKEYFLRTIGWLALASFSVLLQGCVAVSFPLSTSQQSAMREYIVKESVKRFQRNKILLVDVSGVISSGGIRGLLGWDNSSVADLSMALEKARKDSDLKALVLRIDSPGGEVAASDMLYELVRRFKAERAKSGKPVVVVAQILGTGASGGYYVALSADKIYVQPTGLTGAIGVIATFPNLSGLTRKIGVDMRVVKSSEKKDIGSLWRDFEPGEREVLQGVVDNLYKRFIEVVRQSRPGLDADEAVRVADGRVYTADQALEKGLVDGVGYLEDSVEKAKELAGIEDAAVVMYKRTSGFRGTLYSQVPSAQPKTPDVSLVEINAESLVGPLRRPGFYYLWMP